MLLFFAPWVNAEPLAINKLDEAQSIAGLWQFRIGDDLNWAAPNLDDSGWSSVEVPAVAPKAFQDDTYLLLSGKLATGVTADVLDCLFGV